LVGPPFMIGGFGVHHPAGFGVHDAAVSAFTML
jgi:hypothetical protein